MSIKHLVKMVDVKNKRDKERKKPNTFSDSNNKISGIHQSDQKVSYHKSLSVDIKR